IYFASVIAAIPAYLLASHLLDLLEQASLAESLFSGLVERIDTDIDKVEAADLRMVKVAVLAVPVALGIGALLNIPFLGNDELTRYLFEAVGDGEPLDSVFSEATSRQLPVLVTLITSKFYLGYPLRTELYGSSNAQWIHLAPWFSGYRDDKQGLVFTTAYAPIAWSEQEGATVHDPRFQVAIPLSAVASAAPFDLDIYHRCFLGADPPAPVDEMRASDDWRRRAKRDLSLYSYGCLALLAAVAIPSGYFLPSLGLALLGGSLMCISAIPPNKTH